jgi:hypothetical protein
MVEAKVMKMIAEVLLVFNNSVYFIHILFLLLPYYSVDEENEPEEGIEDEVNQSGIRC